MAGAGDAAERRFVREALLALGGERPGLREAARAVQRWDRVLAIAREGSVAESIGAAASLRGVEEEIPEPARSDLAEAHAGATARNALLLAEAALAQAVLDAAGIESVVLKGPGLIVAHYPDIGARHVGDIDLLVRERDMPQALKKMHERGGSSQAPEIRYDGSVPRAPPRAAVHEAPIVMPSGILIEVHDRVPGGSETASDVEGVFLRSRRLSWQGRTIRVPSTEDNVAIASGHVFEHHSGDPRFLLRHLADLAVSVGSGRVNWEAIADRLPPGTARTIIAASRRLLDRGPPGEILSQASAVRARVARWKEILGDRELSPGGVLRVLFPAPDFMAARYGVPEGSLLVPLLYVWRPVRGAWGLLTGR